MQRDIFNCIDNEEFWTLSNGHVLRGVWSLIAEGYKMEIDEGLIDWIESISIAGSGTAIWSPTLSWPELNMQCCHGIWIVLQSLASTSPELYCSVSLSYPNPVEQSELVSSSVLLAASWGFQSRPTWTRPQPRRSCHRYLRTARMKLGSVSGPCQQATIKSRLSVRWFTEQATSIPATLYGLKSIRESHTSIFHIILQCLDLCVKHNAL